jgi:hypothetical protein
MGASNARIVPKAGAKGKRLFKILAAGELRPRT